MTKKKRAVESRWGKGSNRQSDLINPAVRRPISLAYLDSFVSLLLVSLLVVGGDDAVFVVIQQDCVHLWPGTVRQKKMEHRAGEV